MIKPLSLSDKQLRLMQTAAKAVPPRRRDEFLKCVASRLGETPTDQAVEAAISAQLAINCLPAF
jgi:hypothetical protein